MAINLGSAYGKITLDASGFIRGIDKAQGGLSAFERSVVSLKNVLLALVSAAVLQKIGSTILDIGERSLLAAARVEELNIINAVLAKNAGLSEEAVNKETQEVRDMGIEAAVSAQVVAEFVRSHLDLAKASDLARVAQDAATISGKNSTEALYGIISGIITLQPEVIRTNGIVINLIQAEKELADQLGINVMELTASQKQQAALNAVLKAGISVAGAYEAAMTTASKIIRSYPRYINDILVNMGTPFLGSFGKATKAVGDFLKKLGEMTGEGGSLRPMLEKLAVSAGILVDKFVIFLKNFDVEKLAKGFIVVLNALVKFATFLIDNWPLIEVILIALAIRLAARNFSPFSTGISGVIGMVIKLIMVIATVVRILEFFGISAGTVGATFVALKTIIGTTMAAMSSLFLSILLIIGAFALLYIAFKTNFMGITTTVIQLWAVIKYYFGLMIKYIVNVFRNANWGDIGKSILWGIANGMLFGIPSLIIAATKAAKSVLATFDRELDAHSPSMKLFKRGVWSGQGYIMGLQSSMDPNQIAQTLAKPIQNQSTSNQQSITMQFAHGVTVREVREMLASNNEMLLNRLNRALGGAG